MRNYIVVAGVLVVGASLAIAADEAKQGTPAPAKEVATASVAKIPVLRDMVLTGKLTLEDRIRDGKTNTIYVLTESSGRKIHLPPDKIEVRKGIDLKPFIDKQVKMSTRGAEVARGEKRYVMVKEVISIEAVEVAAPAPKADMPKDAVKGDGPKGE